VEETKLKINHDLDNESCISHLFTVFLDNWWIICKSIKKIGKVLRLSKAGFFFLSHGIAWRHFATIYHTKFDKL
jgi:hypothetical protein